MINSLEWVFWVKLFPPIYLRLCWLVDHRWFCSHAEGLEVKGVLRHQSRCNTVSSGQVSEVRQRRLTRLELHNRASLVQTFTLLFSLCKFYCGFVSCSRVPSLHFSTLRLRTAAQPGRSKTGARAGRTAVHHQDRNSPTMSQRLETRGHDSCSCHEAEFSGDVALDHCNHLAWLSGSRTMTRQNAQWIFTKQINSKRVDTACKSELHDSLLKTCCSSPSQRVAVP